MAQKKIGIELGSFRLPLRDAIRAAAECGADAIEIDGRGDINPQISQTGIRQFRKMLDDLRLRVCALAFRVRGGFVDPEGLDQRVDATKKAMQFAYQLGATVVVSYLGRIPNQQDSSAWQLLREVLQDLGAHGDRVGAVLAAETAGERGEDLARLVAALPPGSLGVDLNPGRLVLQGFSPEETIALLGPAILHVHASDATSGSGHAEGRAVPLGQGAVDYAAVLGALDEHGYRGYFTIQLPPVADSRTAVAEAVKYLRRW